MAIPADEKLIEGTWKMSFMVPTPKGKQEVLLLLKASQKEKLQFEVLGCNFRIEPKISKASLNNDLIAFDLDLGNLSLIFEGKLQKDKEKKIIGTLTSAESLVPIFVEMYPSNLKNLTDKLALLQELFDHTNSGEELFTFGSTILSNATEKTIKLEQLRSIIDKLNKSAEKYGHHFQIYVSQSIAMKLIDRPEFANLAIEQIRQAERLLTPEDTNWMQMNVLTSVQEILRKGKKDAEAAKIATQLTRLEARDYLEYSKTHPPFKITPEKKSEKGDRALLVELFTGAECPPCVAADLAFDGLEKTYATKDVILLQYHLHIPGPDPMVNPDNIKRQEFYGDKIQGTPTILFNGSRGPRGGGTSENSSKLYNEYRKLIADQLGKTSFVKLKLKADLSKDEIIITGTIKDFEDPQDNIRLRFAVVEDRVRYLGGNGLRYHHCVVRAMPGGSKGFPVKEKDIEQKLTIKIDEIRNDLNKYLSRYEEDENVKFPTLPVDLKNIRIVAFVQNDKTNEVLQAVQVEPSMPSN